MPLTPKSFWSLLESFTSRSLTYDGDALNAMAGILKSLEQEYGRSIWGAPATLFSPGLSWTMNHMGSKRCNMFPSWSWAGWKSHPSSCVRFVNTQSSSMSLEPEWHYHRADDKGEMSLQKIVTTIEAETSAKQLVNSPSHMEKILSKPQILQAATDGICRNESRDGHVENENHDIPHLEWILLTGCESGAKT